MKRALDLVLVALAAPVLLPLTLALAAAVLLADGGPVLFTQERLGRKRRPFRILKLRTMSTEADEAARRPTRLGAFLRGRGLDELPQLWNVLAGEMSLVGPRPLTGADARRLFGRDAGGDARFDATPGLTGLAQVCLARGARATAELDNYYARRRSLRMDLWVLLRTAGMNVLGKRRGAARLASDGMLD
jgi:lipopolysaccharide/colanic/teichoic acid biosynthesis glycosyltransferase